MLANGPMDKIVIVLDGFVIGVVFIHGLETHALGLVIFQDCLDLGIELPVGKVSVRMQLPELWNEG